MADEVARQQDRTPDVPQNGGDDRPAERVSQEQWQTIGAESDARRSGSTAGDTRGNNNTTTSPDTTNNQTTGSEQQQLTLTNAFEKAQSGISHVLENLGFRRAEKTEGGKDAKDKGNGSLSPDSCASCTIPTEQASGGGSDAFTSHFKQRDHAKPETTLEKLENGQLRRTSTTRNADGSSLTVTTREEYVRDAQGNIQKDKNGRDMTRVMEEDKEAKDATGRAIFRSHRDNKYNTNGDLTQSHEELSRIGQDGKLNKYNSFDIRNEYNEKGQLTGHHATVNDVKGVAVQSTDATYTYDANGNRKTEDILRVNGDKQATREQREHTWQQFGNRFEIVKTEAKLGDGGKLTTNFDRDEKGALNAEHTTETDKKGRVRHQFDAQYNEDGSRFGSRDVHTTFHANGSEASVTTSIFNSIGDSTATRIEKDEKGNVTNERGITQQEDGTIVDSKTGNTILATEAGQALGGYWDKETAWAQLERLSGDATNRDVMSGWDQLGRFAGGPGKQADAVAKLEKWGQGSAVDGVTVLEQKFGNGDGRASQGLDTYLSLGAGAAAKETLEHTTNALSHTYNGLALMLNGGKTADGKNAWEHFAAAGQSFGEAADSVASTHRHAEKAREMINPDAATSGDLLTVHGNGCAATGSCNLSKDGDGDLKGLGKPGEADPVMRGILENLKWSPSGSFGDATQLRLDVAGGDMMRLRDMTAQMGTTETLENGVVVTNVSRMQGNDNMLRLGTVPADVNAAPTEVRDAQGNVVRDAQGNAVMRDAQGNVQVRDAQGNVIQPDANGNVIVRDAQGKVVAEVPAHVAPAPVINPEQAVEQFKRAGMTPEGHYEPMQAARNFFEGGVKTAMTTDSQGRPTPVLDAQGQPVYLRSGEHGVEAVIKLGGGNPVAGMDAMTTLSRTVDRDPVTGDVRRDPVTGEVREVTDMRVGFTQLPKIGETLVATENGTVVPVRDSAVSAQTIINYGAPARDAEGNPVPVRDAQGNVIPQGVVGAQALVEMTRTSTGTDGARIYESIQAATGNERAMFARAVAEAKVEPGSTKATFSAAETTRENLQFIGRSEGQTSGSALEGARVITREQTTPDGRTFTISPDGSVVGGLNTIRQADSAPAGQKTVMGGAQEIALFQARQEGQPAQTVQRDELGFPKPLQQPVNGNGNGGGQTFIEGARNTAMMADRTEAATGRPVQPTQLFTNGITNVQSYSKEGTFSAGRETIAQIGGGSERVDSIPRGIQQVRTAADTTTNGSVSQMAAVTAAAGGGDPRVGAESMMTYKGRDGQPSTSYSEGARQLYTDLYGAPNAQRTATQTLQPRDVERAVAIATPGVAPQERLQSGMDKTNEIVRASGNTTLTGSSVLTNLSNNERAMEAVRTATTPVQAREALVQQGVFQQIVTPVVRTETAAATATATEAAAAKTAEQRKKEESALVGGAPVVTAPVVAGGNVVEARREAVVGHEPVVAARETTVARDTTTSNNVVALNNNNVTGTLSVDVVAASTTKAVADAKVAEVKAAEVKAAEVKAEAVKAAAVEAKQIADAAAHVVRQVFGGSNNADVRVNQTLSGERGAFTSNLAKIAVGEHAANSLQTIISAYKTAGVEAARTAASTNVTVGNAVTARAVAISTADATAVRTHAAAAANNVYISMANAVSAANANMAKAAAAAAAGNANAAQHSNNRIADVSALRTGGSVAIGVDGRPMTLRASISSVGDSTTTKSTAATTARSMDLVIGRTFGVVGNGIDATVASEVKTLKGRAKKFRRLGEDDLAMLGAEIALVALLVSASIAKEKTAKAEAKAEGALELAKASDGLVDATELDNKEFAKAAFKALTRPTWLVRGDEDLVKLAEHLFHEAELGWLIADLNMGQTKESYVDGKRIVELKERQRIDLPVWQDIVEFHKNMPKQARPENLVTIVSENAVDTELMNATLGLAMGATEVARPAVPAAAPLPAPKPALVIAGLAPKAKEGDRRPLLASAKKAAMMVRRAGTAALQVQDRDQGPTAGAVATTEELTPKYV